MLLSGMDLLVRKGEVFGITGINGAGKTVLIKVLATILKPTGGKIEIGGHDLVKERNRVRSLIGYMPDSARLEDRLTVKEHLNFFLSMYPENRRDNGFTVEELLNAIGLNQINGAFLSDLSNGIRQKISFARAIIHNPSVLLLDNPDMGMDWEGKQKVCSLLRELSAKKKTILISSHSMAFLNSISHKIGVLHKGRLMWSFPAGVESQESIQARIRDVEGGMHEPNID